MSFCYRTEWHFFYTSKLIFCVLKQFKKRIHVTNIEFKKIVE